MEGRLDRSGKKILSKKGENHWRTGLLKAMRDPKLIVLEDELTVAIKDLCPKSKYHYLVCPKDDIPTIKNVKAQNLDLLKHMHQVGEILSGKKKECNFLLGYHSIPSMYRLHMHVISDDFDSLYLKTKKHWNSFTTDFFIPSLKLINELEKNGKITFKTFSEYKVFIDNPLKCHKCEYIPKNMPDLKDHLKTHCK